MRSLHMEIYAHFVRFQASWCLRFASVEISANTVPHRGQLALPQNAIGIVYVMSNEPCSRTDLSTELVTGKEEL